MYLKLLSIILNYSTLCYFTLFDLMLFLAILIYSILGYCQKFWLIPL